MRKSQEETLTLGRVRAKLAREQLCAKDAREESDTAWSGVQEREVQLGAVFPHGIVAIMARRRNAGYDSLSAMNESEDATTAQGLDENCSNQFNTAS